MARELPLDVVRGWMAEPELRERSGVFAAHELAAAGDPESPPALAGGSAPAWRRGLADAARAVRIAAAWAAGQLLDGASRVALAALARDPDPEMGAFALEALARVDGLAS